MSEAIGDISSLTDFDVSRALRPGTKRALYLDVLTGLTASVRVPALLAVGAHPGPTLMVVAGVHGDEFEGPTAIWSIFRALDPAVMAGRFIGLPVCNPMAYEAQARTTPDSIDGLNLARVFPGDENGLPTQRLAHQLFQLALRHVGEQDLFVDLHSAGTRYEMLPLVGYRNFDNAGRRASEEAVRRFGIRQIWRIETSPGMFNTETARRNLPTVGTEITGRGGCRPEDAELYATGVRNLLVYKGIVPGPAPAAVETPARPGLIVPTPASGAFESLVALGEDVRVGQPLGRIRSPLGDDIATIASPHRGTIWARRTFTTIRAGEMAYWIGEP